MTQPEHPFKDLPEGAVVTKRLKYSNNWWDIELKNNIVNVWQTRDGAWWADIQGLGQGDLGDFGPTPDAALQALRQAVRELANDLGVV